MTRSIQRGYPWPPARAKAHSYERKPFNLSHFTMRDMERMLAEMRAIDWVKVHRQMMKATEQMAQDIVTMLNVTMPEAIRAVAEGVRAAMTAP